MTVSQQQLKHRAKPSHPPAVAARVAGDRLPLLDRARLDQLCITLGSARVEGLLDLLSRELANRPAVIRAAVLAGDVSLVRHESHSFKGATTSVGAMALGKVAATIEKAPDLRAMAAALPALDRQAMRTRLAINTFSFSTARLKPR